MPDPGFEEAWKFLMDPDYFYAAFGPTTVERHDPLFVLKPGCCWWSGQSWPFATTQTLKAMANVLQNYGRSTSRGTITCTCCTSSPSRTARTASRTSPRRCIPTPDRGPATTCPTAASTTSTPDSRTWSSPDWWACSPATGDTLTIDPLAPDTWDYFALDHLPYRGHRLAVVWDKTGQRYGLGAGLHVLVNGKKAAYSADTREVDVDLPPAVEVPMPRGPVQLRREQRRRLVPAFVGLARRARQRAGVRQRRPVPLRSSGRSIAGPRSARRATATGWPSTSACRVRSTRSSCTCWTTARASRRRPASIWSSRRRDWKPVPAQQRRPAEPVGRRPNTVTFPVMEVAKLRVVFHHAEGGRSGLTAVGGMGAGRTSLQPAPPPAGNVAFNATGEGYPKATASHSDRFGGRPERAIDGKIIYIPTPMNRWTSYESPNEQDWLEVDFGEAKTVSRAVLHIYDDRGGVQPPKDYVVQAWTGQAWRDVDVASRDPEKPTGSMANTVTFAPVATGSKVRVLFLHDGRARSGVTELEIWEK
jgi:hypothetical protein